MVGVVLATHGGLGEALIGAMEMILGAQPRVGALSLQLADRLEDATARLQAALAGADEGDGVLVLTDMFGDTPSNAAISLRQEGRVEVVSGVNLPMVVRLGCTRATSLPLAETARWLEIKGRRSICRAGVAESGPENGGDGTGG